MAATTSLRRAPRAVLVFFLLHAHDFAVANFSCHGDLITRSRGEVVRVKKDKRRRGTIRFTHNMAPVVETPLEGGRSRERDRQGVRQGEPRWFSSDKASGRAELVERL